MRFQRSQNREKKRQRANKNENYKQPIKTSSNEKNHGVAFS